MARLFIFGPCATLGGGGVVRVLLVDADSKTGFPNLALMKLSAWYKQQGNQVDLIRGIPTTAPLETYDKTFISCIYFQNREAVLDYAAQVQNVQIGGSGYDYNIRLDHDVEHIMPDYSLYDDVDFSMGFTSRGCIRSCPWCVVPEKEGPISDNAPVSEFLDPQHKKVVLLDNNFQASPKWRENIRYIIDNKLKVNFTQGLDARLVDEEFADMLSETKCYDWHFKKRGAHLAYDTPSMKQPLLKALKLLNDAGMPPKRFLVYVLVGFNTTLRQDIDRVDTIIEAGAKPYIMPYNNTKDKQIRHLARWINRKYYEFIPIEQYKGGVLAEVAE